MSMIDLDDREALEFNVDGKSGGCFYLAWAALFAGAVFWVAKLWSDFSSFYFGPGFLLLYWAIPASPVFLATWFAVRKNISKRLRWALGLMPVMLALLVISPLQQPYGRLPMGNDPGELTWPLSSRLLFLAISFFPFYVTLLGMTVIAQARRSRNRSGSSIAR
jgi:hypothetical protein